MPSVGDVLRVLEDLAPSCFALSYDKVGLQVGDPTARVEKAVVSLDRSIAAAKFAASKGAQFLLSHHPLIWEPLASVTMDSHVGRTAMLLCQHGISFAAAHTNWDAAQGGINDTLASKLGLKDLEPFGDAAVVGRLKVVVFSPSESVQKVIEAASDAGAGVIGMYRRCAFHHAGTGTFLGLEGASPAVGQTGRVEEVAEVRIEMVVPANVRVQVEEAVKKAHPYEEPAVDFLQLTGFGEQPIGRVGRLPEALPISEFGAMVDCCLETTSWVWGAPERKIGKVAVCGGAADEEWHAAMESGADVLVTGEVKQHVALEASESGFAIVAAGHYATENPGCVALRNAMANRLPEIEWVMFEPHPGFAGRPLRSVSSQPRR